MKTSFLVDKTVEPPVSLSASCDVRLDVEEAELGSGLTESLLVSGGGDFVRTCKTKKKDVNNDPIIIHAISSRKAYLCKKGGVSGNQLQR